MSSKSNRLSPEVRERAVRMVQDHRGEYPSLWVAIESIAPKIGCVPQTLHEPPAGLSRRLAPGATRKSCSVTKPLPATLAGSPP